jgi:hypothetical protein
MPDADSWNGSGRAPTSSGSRRAGRKGERMSTGAGKIERGAKHAEAVGKPARRSGEARAATSGANSTGYRQGSGQWP